jgi:hypothetical protein
VIHLALALWFVGIFVAAIVLATRDAIRLALFRSKMRRSRDKHWRPGRCIKCGYDIRANTTRCSECGEVLPVVRVPPRKLL